MPAMSVRDGTLQLLFARVPFKSQLIHNSCVHAFIFLFCLSLLASLSRLLCRSVCRSGNVDYTAAEQ